MKTYKTKRGIQFNLQVVEIGYRVVTVEATCAQGSKVFAKSFSQPVRELESMYNIISTGFDPDLAANMDKVRSWVDAVTISHIASEASELCVSKETETEYWQFNMFYQNSVVLNITVMGLVDGLIRSNTAHYSADEYDEIIKLIEELKSK